MPTSKIIVGYRSAGGHLMHCLKCNQNFSTDGAAKDSRCPNCDVRKPRKKKDETVQDMQTPKN